MSYCDKATECPIHSLLDGELLARIMSPRECSPCAECGELHAPSAECGWRKASAA